MVRCVLAAVVCSSLSSGLAHAADNGVAAPPTNDGEVAPAAAPAAVPKDSPAALTAPPAGLEAAPPKERTANNAIYIEGLGPGLLYSLNYDRAFGDFAGRIGIGYASVGVSANSESGTSGGSSSARFLTVPITVSYLGIGSKKHMFEVGAGATILNVGANASAFDVSSSSSSSSSGSNTYVFGNVLAGYRFQPPNGGFLLRAGLDLVLGGDSLPVFPWPYLALGGTF
jgi:hypothetical protein